MQCLKLRVLTGLVVLFASPFAAHREGLAATSADAEQIPIVVLVRHAEKANEPANDPPLTVTERPKSRQSWAPQKPPRYIRLPRRIG